MNIMYFLYTILITKLKCVLWNKDFLLCADRLFQVIRYDIKSSISFIVSFVLWYIHPMQFQFNTYSLVKSSIDILGTAFELVSEITFTIDYNLF